MFKKKTIDDLLSTSSIKLPSTMAEIDKLSGKDFEIFISNYFKEVYGDVKRVELTDDTGDKGIDLLIDFNNDTRIGIQAKRWKGRVGSVEVSKMLRGKSHYKANKLYFITNSTLTSQAKTAAYNENVEVWDREKVIQMLAEFNKAVGNEVSEEKTYIVDEYFSKLKDIRKDIAKKYSLFPLYTVFTDKTISEIIKINPRKTDDLYKITGLGEVKINKFGDYLIKRIVDLQDNTKSKSIKLVEVKSTNAKDEKTESLKKLRKEIGEKYNIYPLYNVFKNTTITDLLSKKPTTLEELYQVRGLGEKRISLFGNDIINFFK